MKFKRFLTVALALIISLMGISVNAASTAPSSYNVNLKDWHLLSGANYLPGGSLHFYYKVNTDGKVIYCMQRTKDAVGGLEKYTLNSELGAGYAYIIDNGYPNVSMTGNKDKDYFITGMALWYYINPNDSIFSSFNLSNGTFRGQSNDVAKWMNKLVTGAKSASYVEPSITLNNANSKLTLSSDGKYYVSNAVSATTKGGISKYTVSLNNAPKGTIITDTNGTSKTTFTNKESFIVKVPVSSISELSTSFSVTASATGVINKAYLYSPAHSAYQTTAAIYPEYKNVSANTNFNITFESEVVISKKDATTGEELPGATLVLKDESGKQIETWVSGKEAHVIKNLKPGKYTLSETIAPDGYVLSTETVTFTIDGNGKVSKPVVMYNTPLKSVVISKKDATTGEELPGATLVLKDSKGKEVETWVSGKEAHVIKNLKPGKYTLIETIAPEGYSLSKETVEFTVNKDGSVDKPVVMYNTPVKSVVISKQDATTGEELPGARLEVRNEKGELVEAWISGDEPHVIKGLEPGKYTLTETMAPDGYELSKETVEFTVKEDGTVDGTVVMLNKPETVEVPSTSSFRTITTSLIGLIIIGLGSMIVYKNYKKNEEA